MGADKPFVQRISSGFKVVANRCFRSQDSLNEAFIIAAKNNDVGAMEVLLASGADPNAKNGAALICAVDSNSKETVAYLISKSALIDIQRESPLRTAMKNRNSEMVFFLIEKGANVEAAVAYSRISLDAAERVNVAQWYKKAEPHVLKLIRSREILTKAQNSSAPAVK